MNFELSGEMAKSTAKDDHGFEAALSYALQSIGKCSLVVKESQKEAMIYLLVFLCLGTRLRVGLASKHAKVH